MLKYRLILFLGFMAAACSTRIEKTLKFSDSIMSEAPDSALMILKGISEKSLNNQRLRARHALLTTMAQDKCYIDVTNDSTIRMAFDWYKHHGTDFDRLKAAYYWGIVLENNGKDAQAALRFRSAELLAAKLVEHRWASLADQHLSAAFSRNYDWVRSKEYAHKSLVEAELAKDTLMADYCRLDLAQQYYVQSQLDSAVFLLNHILHSTKDSSLYSYASVSLAKLYLFLPSPDYKRADSLYNVVLDWNVIPLSCQDYGHLALISEKNQDYSQSEEYCRQSEQLMKTAADSVTFYTILSNICDLKGDLKRANEYYGIAVEIQNRMAYTQLEQSITHAIENHYQDEVALEKEKGRIQIFVLVLIGFVLVGIIILLIRLLRSAKQQLLEKMAQIQDFTEDLNRLQSNDSANKLLLDYYSQDRVKTLNALANAFFSWDSGFVRQREKRFGNKTKDELVEEFQKQLAQFRKSDQFYLSLEQALNTSNNNLMTHARQVLSEMNNTDFELVLLFLSGFSAKSICFLKDMTEAAVRMRKTRLKQFFASLPDGRGDVFIKKLETVDKGYVMLA